VTRKVEGYLLVALAALLYGGMGVIAKLGYGAGLTAPVLLFLRFGTASVVLWIILYVQKKPLHTRDVLNCVPTSMAYVVASFSFFAALKFMNASVVNLIFYVYPALVNTMTALFLREKMASTRIVSLVLAFAGCTLAVGVFNHGSSGIVPAGVVMAALSSVCYALFVFYSQLSVTDSDPLVVSTLLNTMSALAIAVIQPPVYLFTGRLTLTMLAYGIFIGLACSVLATWALMAGIGRIGSGKASIISSFEPVVTILFAFLLLGETLSPVQGVGACLVLSAILLQRREETLSPADQPAPRTRRGQATDNKAARPPSGFR
jgi:drug/metabolite transporter (DMT)-like permease